MTQAQNADLTAAPSQPMTDPKSSRWLLAYILLSGTSLGYLAYLSDLITGIPGAVLIALTSSGFAWGIATFAAGYWSSNLRAASFGGIMILSLATLVYYACVVVLSQRWRGGVLDDGTPADAIGLQSVLRASVFWLLGSLVAGPLFGMLGWVIARGRDKWRPMALGLLFGLLSGQGLDTLVFVGSWHRLDRFGIGIALGATLIVVGAASFTLWLARATHLTGLKRALLWGIAASIAVMLAWEAVTRLRMVIGV